MSVRDEFQAFIATHPEVERFDGFVFDLAGHARGKRYTRETAANVFRNGTMISNSIFLMDVTGAVLNAVGKGFSDGDPDVAAHVVPGTLKLIPWAPRPTAQFMLMMDKDPIDLPNLDPRVIAGKTLDALGKRGLSATAAFEIEFYLIERRTGPDGLPKRPKGVKEQPQVYDLDLIADFEPVIEEILATAEAQDLPVTVASSEYGLGQFEANLLHGDALSAADQCLLLRRLIKAVAARHNFQATFMPKPYLNDAGSGMHINISLQNAAGKNVFHAPDGPSDTMHHAIGGCQAALAESVAIFAPNRNAYRRYIANQFVPVNGHWGISNRSVAFRAMLGNEGAQRIEHRFASSDANPYLALAAVVSGILYGMDNKLDPGAPAQGNVCDYVDPDLPLDFDTALARADKAEILPQFMGDYITYYVDAKRRELQKLRRDIPPIEYRWYL